MNKQIHISQAERKLIEDILSNLDAEVLVFGSRVTGEHQPFSDIDICLKAKQKLPHPLLSDLRMRFEESNLPYRVDLIDYHIISTNFQQLVDAESTSLY